VIVCGTVTVEVSVLVVTVVVSVEVCPVAVPTRTPAAPLTARIASSSSDVSRGRTCGHHRRWRPVAQRS
jgi:hypothetical protein